MSSGLDQQRLSKFLRSRRERTLTSFQVTAGHKDQGALRSALDAWFHEAQNAEWHSSAELKKLYATASIVSADRVVFNIKGNSYRLVVAIDYEKGIVWIKGWALTRTTIKLK